MYENKFDETLDEVSNVHDLNWSDDSKIKLFARFLEEKHPELYSEWENFLETQADQELTTEVEEFEEDLGRCFAVEWAEWYHHNRQCNYEGAGDIAYVPFNLLDGKGEEDEQVGRAFEKHTGVSPIHIVSYSFDVQYDSEGNELEPEPPSLEE